MPPIKHPARYDGFNDPQSHPRYTGIATLGIKPGHDDLAASAFRTAGFTPASK